ncbi:unnamed protein product [Amaranthus hypochondriacus]
MLEKIILAKSFVKIERKRFGLWALFSFFMVMISLCAVLKPYRVAPIVLVLSDVSEKTVAPIVSDVPSDPRIEPSKSMEKLESLCVYGEKSNFCELNGDIRIHGNSSSIYFTSSQLKNKVFQNNSLGVKLYARKIDRTVMKKIKEVWIKPILSSSNHVINPNCTINHSVPFIVLSTGGYAGNIFHDTSDVLIPLYLTSLHFNGEVQFLAQEKNPWWINRHEVMFKALSNYPIIDFDHDDHVRCFKGGIVGLKSNKDFGISLEKFNPNGLSLRNFTQFNRRVYSLKRDSVTEKTDGRKRKPRLLIVSRMKTRAILNEDELKQVARRLGFEVKVVDANMNLKNFSKIVNSMDVMVGVHGAGLTNMIYLPENAVLIQIVPIGCGPISRIFYEIPARDMNLNYLEYKVNAMESSLIEQYPRDHIIINDPSNAIKNDWLGFKKVYMDNQDVRLDLSRFKLVLLKALAILSHKSGI